MGRFPPLAEPEGTAFCQILSNSFNSWQRRLHGDIMLNGVSVSPARLQDRVAYVRRNNAFGADMSVRQTMLFHSFLREPGTHSRARDAKGRVSQTNISDLFPQFACPQTEGLCRRCLFCFPSSRYQNRSNSTPPNINIFGQINALIEDLGLSQVKHTRVKDLTISERQRLNVACHLLLDADIVVLDQPTDGMDIFDTFFLVEYLRQWAARGRIVVLTLQPPTYEILTMISKVVLLSAGRVMYYGKRREMLPYFAFIEYPCPAYKNPSDYYRKLHFSIAAVRETLSKVRLLPSPFS